MPAEAIEPEDKPAEVEWEVGVGFWAGRLLALECTRRNAVITGVTGRSPRDRSSQTTGRQR